MIEATSCGGVVIFRGKILVLYKNYKNKYEGWVLPKGTVEAGEEYKETALIRISEMLKMGDSKRMTVIATAAKTIRRILFLTENFFFSLLRCAF